MLRSRSAMTVVLTLAFTALASMVAPSHALAATRTTFVVNKIGDASDNNLADSKCDTSTNSGKQCTLRAAIQEANDTAGRDTINFNITSASKVIAPSTELPAITEAVTVNGYSQSGAAKNSSPIGNNAVLKIVLDGVNAPASANGFELASRGSTITGLVIQHFHFGIYMTATGSGHAKNVVVGNFIGTDVTGTQARPNSYGIRIDSSLTFIGGLHIEERNLISGNDVDGIFVSAGSTGTRVLGNYIGTDASGNTRLGNGVDGISSKGTNVDIGGGSVALRNVISANGHAGIEFAETDIEGNSIVGNYVGTKADGTGDLGNEYGIIFDNIDHTTIGGTSPGQGNLISGNDSSGILFTTGSNFNGVIHNVIKENGLDGFWAKGGSSTAVTGNTIYSNGRNGILVGSSAGRVNVSDNQIFSNGALGIDLSGGTEDAFGTTANDTDDPDAGANNLQNYPLLGSALYSTSGHVTVVPGSLNSTPSAQYRIDLYVAVADASGHGEGQILRGSQVITTNTGGDKSFSFNLSTVVAGQIVTATATRLNTGDTSEFSINRTVIGIP